MRILKKPGLAIQVIIATVLAIIAGVVFGSSIEIVKPLGDLFLRLIKFVIAPLILTTLVVGVAGTGNIKELGKMGGKTIIYFFATTIVAVFIGLVFGELFSPGTGVHISATGKVPDTSAAKGVVDTILGFVPTNPIKSIADTDVMGIIFFAIFIGIGITMVGEKAQPVYRFFDGFQEVMQKITGIVIKIIPLGIFGLLAPIIGSEGLSVLIPLLKLLITIAIACMVHAAVVYSISVKTIGKVSPFEFFKGVFPASMLAFTSSSSSATLPVTQRCVEQNFGVKKNVSGFVLPLGATINMDGQAIYFTICCLFTAQLYGVHLTFTNILMIIIFSTIGSVGTAGMAGAGIVMLAVVMSSVHLPLEGIAVIAGIDRFLNMFSTSLNVTGDASASIFVNRSKNKENHNIADTTGEQM